MEIIIHRVNKIKDLNKLDQKFGVEIDLRSYKNKVILSHEPFENGDNFEDYIDNYKHGTLVLNIKEAGIENEVLKIVKKNKKIKNYFLLDVETPYLFKCLNKKNKVSALRVSYYEPLEKLKKFKLLFNWFWLDSIIKLDFSDNDIKLLNKYKTCFVCPERWGKPELISFYKNYFKKKKIKISAVMTSIKYVEKWLDTN